MRQFLVKIQPLPGTKGGAIIGYWSKVAGGASAATLTKVWDGGAQHPEVLAGIAVVEDITLTRPFQPERDQAIIKALKPQVGRYQAVISVQPTDADLNIVADAESYSGILAKVTSPAVDAASSEPAVFELMFTVASVA
jgi:hypothetical protein